MKISRTFVIIAALLAIVVIAGWAWNRDRNDSDEKIGNPEITMGYLPMISSLTYFVAVEEGYFIEEDLDVRGIPIATSDNIASSLVNGDIDIGVELAISPLLRKIADGPKSSYDQPTVKVFSHSLIDESNGFDSVLVKADSPINSWKDLSGKTIAAFPGTTAERTIYDVFRRDFGSTPPPTVMTKVPTLHLASLESGEVQALHTYEPFLTQGLVVKKFRRIRSSLYAAQMPLDQSGQRMKSPVGVAAINSAWARKNPKLAAKALRALDRAVTFINKYPDRSRVIAAKFTGSSPNVTATMNIMPMTRSDQMDTNLIQTYINILLEMKDLTKPIPASKIMYVNSRS